jgi:hypothetical protein
MTDIFLFISFPSFQIDNFFMQIVLAGKAAASVEESAAEKARKKYSGDNAKGNEPALQSSFAVFCVEFVRGFHFDCSFHLFFIMSFPIVLRLVCRGRPVIFSTQEPRSQRQNPKQGGIPCTVAPNPVHNSIKSTFTPVRDICMVSQSECDYKHIIYAIKAN